MFAYSNNDRTGRPICAVVYNLLLLILLWVFISTVDGPVVNFSSTASSIGYSQTPRFPEWQSGGQSQVALIGVLHDETPVLHASFHSFDIKQNLRLWPVSSDNLSRSPPRLLER